MPATRAPVNLIELASRIERLQEQMEADGCDRCGGPVVITYDDQDGTVTAACEDGDCDWNERREP